MHPQVQEFSHLFEGWNKNYGTYKVTGEIDERGKALGQAVSITGEVTLELWHDHLMGIQGLGIIPITDQSKVKFAAIDIDDYGIDIKEIVKQINEEQLPLVPCRTKSGGLHLYMFLTDWAPAKLVQQRMREMAAKLGHGSSEIFPKQHTILAARGDIGQWINMPYFKADGTNRYGIDINGYAIPVDKFPKVCFDKMLTPEMLAVTKYSTGLNDGPLSEGPPCLNHLASKGFPLGTRNNGLFNLGIYAQKFNPDGWETTLHEFNRKFMDPPLSPSEVMGVVKSLNKAKGYNYTCKQQPIVSHCNVNKCRACKFGVGMSGIGMPVYGTLCKVNTKPPVWFVDIEGGDRVELTTESLQGIRGFQKSCMEGCNIMPPMIKGEIWNEVVSKLLAEVTVVEVPEESTPQGVLRQLLNDFCMSKVQAKMRDEILMGKPYHDKEHGIVMFRMRDLMAYLDRQRFKDLLMNRIAVYLRDWGAEKRFLNLKGTGINVYTMTIKQLSAQNSGFEVPSEVRRTNAF